MVNAVITKMHSRAGVLTSVGKVLSDMLLSLGTLGRKAAKRHSTIAERIAMRRKVTLQPTISPTALPSGSPTIIAIEEPVMIMLNAVERCPSGATWTARGVTMDQNTA